MSFRRLAVLVVDDCAYMRTIVTAMLRGLGFEIVLEAADGAQALEELRFSPVDLIITDYAMPTLDGLELTQMLRRAPDSPARTVPIIIMTAHTERSRIAAARDAGIHELMSKPLSAQTLIDRLASVIDHPRPWIECRAYVGPCRRRHKTLAYQGPMRRSDDDMLDLETDRQAVRR